LSNVQNVSMTYTRYLKRLVNELLKIFLYYKILRYSCWIC